MGVARLGWSQKDIATLERLYKTHTHKEIAKLLGRSPAAVKAQCKIRRLLKVSFWSEYDNKILADMYKQGSTVEAIANHLGRTVGATTTQIWALKLATRVHEKDIGYERISARGHLERKIATGKGYANFKRVDIIEWEAMYGAVPEGMELMTANPYMPHGPNNLKLIPKGTRWDTVIGRDSSPEVQELLLLQTKLAKAVKQRTKSKKP